jgi:hypothetical protein
VRLFVMKGRWFLEFDDGGFCSIGREGHVGECARFLRDLFNPCWFMEEEVN